ncbi:MAG: fumarylacetoacetate hydrolase family protein [Alphaproteobacteria bacterium]|nr:fumarylacetoacetate hydrolase family protein [Alphaproteobacteria bacterium]
MDAARVQELGGALFAALEGCHTRPPLTSDNPAISIDDAYRISLDLLARRRQSGERLIGKKIGVTSRVVMDMLGVHQPDFGFLTDAMQVAEGSMVAIAGRLIQPRAEAEIAFRLKSDLTGPGVDEAAVIDATASVHPCFEIVDSRIADWNIRIEDTVADNASCGVFVLGDGAADPMDFDFETCGAVVWKNDEIISTGAGAAALGSPVTAVAWLANTLGRYGICLTAGDIILSGSLVPLAPALPGDRFRMKIAGLGSTTINFA